MDYTPWNIVVWGLFAGFAAICWIVVRLFHRRNPDYPGKLPDTLK